MSSWDEIHSARKPVQVTVRVPMRADLLDEIDRLEVQARRERDLDDRENREPVAPGIAARIVELEDELAASEVEFTFAALGRREYHALVAEHPPTDAQKAEAAEEDMTLNYNADTFPPAFLAASCVQPAGTTLADMTKVWETWSQGQSERLWRACLAANMGAADVGPKSVTASAILRGSGRNSTTADR